ncbi:MAG: hypothetical protein R3B45_08565 [Bdellovibrionota bacterium]
MRLILLFYAFSLYSFQAIGNSNPPLGDRVLAEINNTFYTQWQLEGYFLIKKALDNTPINEKSLQRKESWQKDLDIFLFDMLIHQDTQKMGSFFPNDQSIDKNLEKIKKLSSTNIYFRDALQVLGLNNKTLKQTTITVIQVKSYKQNKNIGIEKDDSIGKTPAWKSDLKKKYIIRRFKDSQNYYPLLSIGK